MACHPRQWDARQRDTAEDVSADQQRTLAYAIDPGAGDEAEQGERNKAQGHQHPDLQHIGVEGKDRAQWQRESGDLGAQLADRGRREQPGEMRVSPERLRRNR
jgi:hypothetical protein